MAKKATYSDDPTNVTIDRVRLEVGDTDCTDALLSDNEITHFTTQEPNVVLASALAAEAIAASFARAAARSGGGISEQCNQKFEQYNVLARRLRTEAARHVSPEMPALTIAGKKADRDDEALVQPNFAVGMHDAPGTAGPLEELEE